MSETTSYLTASQMAKRCKQALRMKGVTYENAGRALGVGATAISNACNYTTGESPMKYASLRRRILERYTDQSVGDVSWPVSD